MTPMTNRVPAITTDALVKSEPIRNKFNAGLSICDVFSVIELPGLTRLANDEFALQPLLAGVIYGLELKHPEFTI